jgi:hypothetical protein
MKALQIFVLGLTLAVMPTPSQAQYISIVADSTGTRCDVLAHPGTPGHAYLLFHRGALGGVSGWACRIDGLPAGWIGSADTDPSTQPWENYLFGTGTVWASPTCRTDDPLILARLTIIATTEEHDGMLLVAPRTPLVNPSLDCALVTQCDAPVYTAVCVAAGIAAINPEEPCVVAVEPRSWTQVKRLYD